jgi:hypothetical protein
LTKLNYELAGDGMLVEGRRIWPPKRTTGFSWVRLEVQSTKIPRPGSAADSEHRIVFMRPHLARSIGYVIGIVLTGLLFIGSIVLFFLRLLSKEGSA